MLRMMDLPAFENQVLARVLSAAKASTKTDERENFIVVTCRNDESKSQCQY